MPTRRAVTIFILATLLYLIANQTQVGWVYLMVDALLALLLVGFGYGLGNLRGLRGERTFCNLSPPKAGESLAGELSGLPASPDFFEDDPLAVTLRLTQTGLRPAFMLAATERCPFAPPAETEQTLFVPSLFKNRPIALTYHTHADRRGLHAFPPLALRSAGPFSLFRRRGCLAVSGELLVYPRYHPLKRLRLLENRGFTDRHTSRAGSSSEVIGTREYRPGDSLRKIHWRSSARTGSLVVKEFADSDHLTLTVLLDLSAQGSVGQGKFSTFETAVRITASLGYYASNHKIPFRLLGHSAQGAPPGGALSWWGALHYLARVQNTGDKPLADLLRQLTGLPFVAVLVSSPTAATIRELAALPRRGIFTLALFITPDGSLPVQALNLSGERLRVKAISPHSWADTLAQL
jgi:uncharacterized protein (DUF58 family)